MNLFEEIDEYKKELPKINNITKEVKKQKLNSYQLIACITMIIAFFSGFIIGNIFPSCSNTSTMFGTTYCENTEFNISLTIIFWFLSFLFCMGIYGFGQMINLLTSIDEKLTKKTRKK